MSKIIVHGGRNGHNQEFSYQVTVGHQGHESFGIHIARFRAREFEGRYLLERTYELDQRGWDGTPRDSIDTRTYTSEGITELSEIEKADERLHTWAVSHAENVQRGIGDEIVDLSLVESEA